MPTEGNGDAANTSERKIRANQQNAANSTGPRTAHGKFWSSQNARKHGLTGVVPIARGEGMEDIEAFEQMRAGLYASWEPVGWQETKLVELLAGDYHRLDRAFRFETGLIRIRCDHATSDTEVSRASRFLTQLASPGLPRPQLWQSTFGIDHLLRYLDSIEYMVESGASFSEKDKQTISVRFWNPGDEFTHRCEAYIDSFARCKKEGKTDEARQWQEACLALIKQQRDAILEKRKSAASQEQNDLEVSRLMCSVPDLNGLDLLCRYMTTINRSIERTMNLLERLQAKRKAKTA